MRRLFLLRLNVWWRAFLLALAAYAALGALTLVFAPDMAGVFLLGAYCIPSNSIIPIPHEPGVLFFAKYYDPIWIATAATIGSLIASFADYAMVGAAIRHPFFRGTRESKLFRWTLRAMKRWPFAIIVLFSFTPLPISVVRILAPAADYPIGRYALAQIVGRFPRFLILAWIGHVLMIPTWVVLALLGVLLLSLYLSSRQGGSVVEAEPEAEDRDAEALA
ncbi:MAG TPA: VTT domain-containing protein [Kofleriaceae bacterium]|nr:VTT domain-containing protein [Kofleriaceae bacterium]